MFKKAIVVLSVIAFAGCSSISINGNKRYKERLCNNLGELYYQIGEARDRGMPPTQLWRAIELGIMDTVASDGISDSEVNALKQWGRSAINNVYKSKDSYSPLQWKNLALNQCHTQVEIY